MRFKSSELVLALIALIGCGAPDDLPPNSARVRKLPGFVRLINLTDKPQNLKANGKRVATGLPGGEASAFYVTKSGDLSLESGEARIQANLGEKEILSAVLLADGPALRFFPVKGEPNRTDEGKVKIALVYVSSGGEALKVKLGSEDAELQPGAVVLTKAETPGPQELVAMKGNETIKVDADPKNGQSMSFVVTDAGGKLRGYAFLNSDSTAGISGASAG